MALRLLFLVLFIQLSVCLIPPKFQWKSIDFMWDNKQARDSAIKRGDYIPQNVMPTGIARWKEKLFITIPRWRKGVPSSLNYIYVDGPQDQPLIPFPRTSAISAPGNDTVVCAFRAYVDACDRLWVVDNGVSDITGNLKQISDPAIFIYDLLNDSLIHKYVLEDAVIRESSVFTSIVVDVDKSKSNDKNKCKRCIKTYAYLTDMGSNAIIVYSLQDNEAWRVENPYFHFDPHAGVYKVGGIDFYWSDGISSAALSKVNKDGFRDLYFHPTSSTKQFKMSTKLLRNKTMAVDDIFNGVKVIGDKGPKSQTTACDYDPQHNVLFYTQLSKNGIGCWNLDKPFEEGNTPIVLSDCTVMEFPNDVKVDQEGNIWMLSNRQSRFLYGNMDYEEINFRVLTAPTSEFIKGTNCEKPSGFCNKLFKNRSKSSISNKSGPSPSTSNKDNEYVCPTAKGKKCPTAQSKICPTSQDSMKEPNKGLSCPKIKEKGIKGKSATSTQQSFSSTEEYESNVCPILQKCRDMQVNDTKKGQFGQTRAAMQGKSATISRPKSYSYTEEYDSNVCPVTKSHNCQDVQVNETRKGQLGQICPAMQGKSATISVQKSSSNTEYYECNECPVNKAQRGQDVKVTIRDTKGQSGQTSPATIYPTIHEKSNKNIQDYQPNECPVNQAQKSQNVQATINHNKGKFGHSLSEKICPAVQGIIPNICKQHFCPNMQEYQQNVCEEQNCHDVQEKIANESKGQSGQTSSERIFPAMLGKSVNISRIKFIKKFE